MQFTPRDVSEIDREWLSEEDEYYFAHRGLDCAIIRNKHTLTLNGYVSVPNDHLLSEVHHFDIERNVSVHGGLTFSGRIEDLGDKWTFGFDCSHLGDLIPIVLHVGGKIPAYALSGTYRNVDYVMGEVRRLANQLIELDNPLK